MTSEAKQLLAKTRFSELPANLVFAELKWSVFVAILGAQIVFALLFGVLVLVVR